MIRMIGYVVLWAMLMVISGCGQDSVASHPSPASATPSSTPSGETAGQHLSIKTYFTDDQALELIEQEKEITFTEESKKYAIAFEELKKSSLPGYIPLWSDYSLHDASSLDGLLTIDLKANQQATGSSLERLMILSLLKTMFQFSEVERIQLLIDGQVSDTLNGHLDISQTFTKEMIEDL